MVSLEHPNPEKVWSVATAIDAVAKRFSYTYSPHTMKHAFALLDVNGCYPGFRSIFVKVGVDAFKLRPNLITKRERERELRRKHWPLMNCVDKLEETILTHDNPEEIWDVDKAVAAVETRFTRKYSVSYMNEAFSRLCTKRLDSTNRNYLPPVLVRVGSGKFKLLPHLIEKRKEELKDTYGGKRLPIQDTRVWVDGEQVLSPKPLGLHRKPPKLTHLHEVDVVSVDEAYYHRLTEDAELLKKVRGVVGRKELNKTLVVSELRELLENTEKPSVKLSRKGHALALERVRKPHRNVRRHTEELTFRMKQALLAPVFNATSNTARGLEHRDLAVEKKGRYFKTTLGEHVTVYLKMQGEK
jgi:hypothetical protein